MNDELDIILYDDFKIKVLIEQEEAFLSVGDLANLHYPSSKNKKKLNQCEAKLAKLNIQITKTLPL